jgi:hypothetical protein
MFLPGNLRSQTFSVRSAYRLALNAHLEQCDIATISSYPDGKHPSWTKIWHASVPLRVKFFAWKAAENKLRRNMRVSARCKICDAGIEDVAHALFKCPHAHTLWEAMRLIWCLPTDDDLVNPSSSWFQNLLLRIPAHMVDTTLLVTWRA